MKVWRLGSCENFVGKREELVFDAFSDAVRVAWWWWLSRALDLRFTGRNFNSQPVAFTQHRSINSALHPSRVAKSRTCFGWWQAVGGILTSVGWQVTLCDPIWHVSFPQRRRAKLMLNCYTLFTFTFTLLYFTDDLKQRLTETWSGIPQNVIDNTKREAATTTSLRQSKGTSLRALAVTNQLFSEPLTYYRRKQLYMPSYA